VTTGTAPLRFDGQVALVTGATSGLGRGHAIELARRGANVVGTVHAGGGAAHHAGEEVRELAQREGLAIELVPADLSIEEDARGIVTDTIDRHGRLDVLVNNAGYNIPGPIQVGSTSQLRAMIDVHLMGTFWTMVPALTHMRARGTGRIVNTVSGAGMFGRADSFAYASSKAAIQAMSRCAAFDNADVDVRVNMFSPIAVTPLSPGYTDLHPDLDADRMSVERVVPALVYLAHPACALNGQTLHAAGGRVAVAGSYVARGWGSDTLTAEDVAAHIGDICDTTDVLVLRDLPHQYDYIPKRSDDFARWVSPAAD
jgi:NAD(P)-dependent dehydrogenase (short-subunit alcohol dehydrogenase family)